MSLFTARYWLHVNGAPRVHAVLSLHAHSQQAPCMMALYILYMLSLIWPLQQASEVDFVTLLYPDLCTISEVK